MPFGTWLLAMAGSLTAKVLLSIGFSVVTITGMSAIISTLKGQLLTAIGAVPAAGFQLALLAGAGEGLSIIFGAIATRILLWQISNATRILGNNTP